MKKLLLCIAIATVCSSASAQEAVMTDRHGVPPNPLFERMGKDQPAYSRSITGKIVEVNSSQGRLVIEGNNQARLTFMVDSRVRLGADKDTSLASRKDLTLADYAPGEVVRVSYRISDNRTLAVRLKGPRT